MENNKFTTEQVIKLSNHFTKQDLLIENTVNNLKNITHGWNVNITDKFGTKQGFTPEELDKVREFIDFIEAKKVINLRLDY